MKEHFWAKSAFWGILAKSCQNVVKMAPNGNWKRKVKDEVVSRHANEEGSDDRTQLPIKTSFKKKDERQHGEIVIQPPKVRFSELLIEMVVPHRKHWHTTIG